MYNYVIFIPARDNSKRLPDKNMVDLNGAPLLSYTLTTAVLAREEIKKHYKGDVLIVLTTNSEEIGAWAKRNYKDGIYVHLRPETLAQDHVQTDEVCVEALRQLQLDRHPILDNNDLNFGILLQPTSPSRTYHEVLSCISEMNDYFYLDAEREYKDFCVITAHEADGFYWRRKEGHIQEYDCMNDDPRFRQGKQWIFDDRPLMKENGAVYLFPLHTLSTKRIYRMPPYIIVHTDPIADVDTAEDLEVAKQQLSKRFLEEDS